MQPETIAMTPPEGFQSKNRPTSREAMAWLAVQRKRLGLVAFRSGRHGGEIKVSGHSIDGMGVDANGQRYLLQYHGIPQPPSFLNLTAVEFSLKTAV